LRGLRADNLQRFGFGLTGRILNRFGFGRLGFGLNSFGRFGHDDLHHLL
jgi:hypothetical protein